MGPSKLTARRRRHPGRSDRLTVSGRRATVLNLPGRRRGLARGDWVRRTLLILAMVPVLSGCAAHGTGRGTGSSAARRKVGQRSATFEVLGASVSVTAAGSDSLLSSALAAASRELTAVDQVHAALTAAIATGNEESVAAGSTEESLRFLGERLARITGGAFGVSFRPLALRWYGVGPSNLSSLAAALDSVVNRVGPDELSTSRDRISRLAPEMEVALDGVLKGQALDQAVAALRRAKVSGGMARAGGYMECYGKPAYGGAWDLPLLNPWSDQPIGSLRAGGEGAPPLGIAMLSGYRLRAGTNRSGGGSAGSASQTVAGVAVVAPDLLTAGVWAVALSILPVEEGKRLVERAENVEALWFLGTPQSPTVRWTPGMPAYVRSLDPAVQVR